MRVNKTNAESMFSFHLYLSCNFSLITTSIQIKIFCLLDFFLILMQLHAIMCFCRQLLTTVKQILIVS